MGAQMYSGDKELAWSSPCWIINLWSANFNEKKPSKDYLDDMGVFDFSSTCVKKMHDSIPLSYDENLVPKDDLLRYGEEDMRASWEEARAFLSHAAAIGDGIRGSY